MTVDRRAALLFLFLGNIVIGSGVLAPAAMINPMAADLGVSAVAIGGLIGWGAVILCIGAPTFGFLTNRVDRRTLLSASLVVYAIGHAASAFAPDYNAVLALRLMMIGGAAIFTPQAASAVALMIPEERRASVVALVFMGWAFAGAAVVPFMSILAEMLSWRAMYAGLAVGASLAAAGILLLMPAGLYPVQLSMKAWGSVLARPVVLVLLATTSLQLVGQFILYPYFAAELLRATHANGGGVALALGLYGGAGLLGSLVAARAVGSLGAPRVQFFCLLAMAAGLTGWSIFSQSFGPTAVSICVWGLGFGAAGSMQQARLIAVGLALASASVALNTSSIYMGQALGSAIGGVLIEAKSPSLLGPVGVMFVVCAMAASAWVHRRFDA